MLAAILVATPLIGRATVFFNDTFTTGSTLNSASPANPTATNTAYEMVASKSWNPTPTMAANDFKMGIAATSSGYFQAQALFATNAVALTQPGDYIQLTVTFTNTSGLLTAAGQLGFGLYNSGQIKPVAGGINNLLPATFTGFAQGWLGYAAAVNFAGATSRILTRPAQTLATVQNQDLITFGTSSSYGSGAVIGTATGNATLVAGSNYTEVLTITLNDVNSLTITNTLYLGPVSGGIVITNFGAVATNTTFLTAGFDALAIGYCGRSTAAGAPVFDISSVKVDGSVTAIGTPPNITSQPVPATVATNGSCVFNVAALGVNVTYQWRRSGTNLLNGGNIAGATSSTLQINNASAVDARAVANGYYCVVSGAGNFSTNSVTNSLTLVPLKNLIWDGGAGSTWDLNNTASWVGSQTFNYGDAVTFDDTGSAATSVSLSGVFLSASKWTVTGSTAYAFSGSGVVAGTGSLVINSSANQQFNGLNNTFTGGTVISNASPTANVYFSVYQGLGNGPLTLAAPGLMEFAVAGSATVGIPGDVNVNDDFTIQFDGTGTFAGVILGNISGTAGKTLTLTPQNTGVLSRYRVYGTNIVCNANLAVNGNTTDQAQYSGTVMAPYGGSGTQVYNGIISGDGGFIQRGNCTTYLNAVNTYAGGSSFTAGAVGLGNDSALGSGPINLAPENGGTTGSGTIFASGGARTIANTVQYPSGTNNSTLIINGTNDITFISAINLAGVDGSSTSNRTFTANNTAATTLSGIISDGGNAIGLVKNGTNTLYLNGANTYSGLTTVSAGRLAGSGNIAGSVIVTSTNASIGGGAATGIGTLTVGGDLTLTNGGGFFRVNRAGLAKDQVSVTGGLTNFGSGKITVTNLGATLQVGDAFAVFNKAVVGGATMTVTGGGVVWTNKLAVNGTIEVIPGVNTGSTNLTAVVNGGKLELSWPADHTGWRLQAQTNTLGSGLGTNWVTISGTDANNHFTNTLDASKGAVFYRMVYP
jgi:autotransporter-associated beta strand protein